MAEQTYEQWLAQNNIPTTNQFGFQQYQQPQQQVNSQVPKFLLKGYTGNGPISTEPVSNTSNSFDVSKGLTDFNGTTSFKVGDSNYYKIPGLNSKADYQKAFGNDIKTVDIGGHTYIKQDQTFMQKYGQGIQLGLGATQLGLGIGNFLENRATAKQQRALLREQLKEAKTEYSRINKARNKLTASY